MNAVKEFFRKKVVGLKRNPSTIPLLMMLFAFLYYSLNLSAVSNSTATIQGTSMGLSEFAIMLLSILSLVCMLNAYPRRKKANIPMIVLCVGMLAIIAYADYHFMGCIANAWYRPDSPIAVESAPYTVSAYNMLSVHQILVFVSMALVVTLPLYKKLLMKINTSVSVADNGEMADIEIEE